jgi:hypothetical protein
VGEAPRDPERTGVGEGPVPRDLGPDCQGGGGGGSLPVLLAPGGGQALRLSAGGLPARERCKYGGIVRLYAIGNDNRWWWWASMWLGYGGNFANELGQAMIRMRLP